MCWWQVSRKLSFCPALSRLEPTRPSCFDRRCHDRFVFFLQPKIVFHEMSLRLSIRSVLRLLNCQLKLFDLISKVTAFQSIQSRIGLVPIEKPCNHLFVERVIDLATHRPPPKAVKDIKKPLISFAVLSNPLHSLIVVRYV